MVCFRQFRQLELHINLSMAGHRSPIQGGINCLGLVQEANSKNE